jgi:hypothetical protein
MPRKPSLVEGDWRPAMIRTENEVTICTRTVIVDSSARHALRYGFDTLRHQSPIAISASILFMSSAVMWCSHGVLAVRLCARSELTCTAVDQVTIPACHA